MFLYSYIVNNWYDKLTNKLHC